MSELKFRQHGLYFEEFEIGQKIITRGRTITEADVVNFAGVSADFNRIHTDAVYTADQQFGERIAHGLLVQSIASGLSVLTGIMEGTVMAFRSLDCKFTRPVMIGDTVHVEVEITELKPYPRLKGGNVVMAYEVLNQKGKAVQTGSWTMLIKSREADEA